MQVDSEPDFFFRLNARKARPRALLQRDNRIVDRVGPGGNTSSCELLELESTSYRQRFRVEVILSSHVESLVSREWIVAKFFVAAHAWWIPVSFLLRVPRSASSSSIFFVTRLPIPADSSSSSLLPFFLLLLLIHPRARL